jgi:hypothetical protein
MKTRILHSSIAAALSVCALQTAFVSSGLGADVPIGTPVDAPSRQQQEQLERDKIFPPANPLERVPEIKVAPRGLGPLPGSRAFSSMTTNSDGTVTITIDVNGKKETRTFNLGGETPFTLISGQGGGSPSKPGEKETWIGIGLGGSIAEEVRAQLPIQPGEGVIVAHVAPESPAAKAGIAQHDILVRLNDQVLVSGDQFKKLVRMQKPGETVKIAYFRKGERKEADVTLAEHEAELERQDVLKTLSELDRSTFKGAPIEKMQDRMRSFREKSETLRDRLKDAKEKFPGVIVDKQSFLLDVDGTVKKLEGELKNVEEVLKNLREQLEKANVSKETVEEIRKAMEGVIQKTGEAARDAALEAVRDFRAKREAEKRVEPPKPLTPAQPLPPAPPINTPQ